MSQFLDTTKTFADHYNLKLFCKIKILIHYPLFKLYWHSNYGKGFVKKISQLIYPLFKYYTIHIEIIDKRKKSLRIPISFDQNDHASFKEIFWGLEYGEVLKMDDIETVFDIGANTGMAALFFLINLPLKKMIIVEANPILAKKLEGVFNDETVIVENLAVYGDKGKLKFTISENHRESTICVYDNVENKNIITVNTVRLEDLLKKHSIEYIDLLKMDIEGAEYNILEKTPKSFLKFKYIYIEIHGDRKTRDKFRLKLMDIGFNLINTSRADHPDCETSFLVRKV